MSRIVRVIAPCRLHFGMFSFGHLDRPQFGGVGMMVDRPTVDVTIQPAARFAVHGTLNHRVDEVVQAVVRNWRLPATPACEINVASPPDHVGLGIGTQLSLSVAAGLRRFLDLPELLVEELASSIGRGTRSAVGTFGFRYGGLIVDAGKEAGQPLGRMAHRVSLPGAWRTVLVRQGHRRGIAGDHEADAFGRMPPVADEVTRELWRITEAEILPAIGDSDCAAFGAAVYRFGRLAGACFASIQGGPFASPEISRLVESIRDYGVPGAGQSSWGPTVFAFVANEAESHALCQWLQQSLDIRPGEITIAAPNNCGAQVSTA